MNAERSKEASGRGPVRGISESRIKRDELMVCSQNDGGPDGHHHDLAVDFNFDHQREQR